MGVRPDWASSTCSPSLNPFEFTPPISRLRGEAMQVIPYALRLAQLVLL